MALTAQAALDRLIEGNRRYVSNVLSVESLLSQLRRAELAQSVGAPIAAIVCCSDARSPAELVFDQGLGDLFVIRVAGNIVAPSQIGSVEFAAEVLDTRLVVVMGHTSCKAIDATLDAIERGGSSSRNIASIVDRIRPAIEGLVRSGVVSREQLQREAVRANVSNAVAMLIDGSPVLRARFAGGLRIVGAEFELGSGHVDFFHGVPLT